MRVHASVALPIAAAVLATAPFGLSQTTVDLEECSISCDACKRPFRPP